MFQLRDEHHQAFASATMAAFDRRAVAHVRANFPEQSSTLSDQEIRIRVRDGMRRAKVYGLESERQIMCFVDTGFLIGPDFDSRPDTAWTRIILQYPDFSADQRAQTLLEGAQNAVREEGLRKDA
jgi:hypothetical protein